jgi:Ca2+-binding EF-hand superfamily protein
VILLIRPACTEEHHITGFDAETFFTLHDFKSAGVWSTNDIRRMYGLMDKTAAGIDEDHKLSAVQHILDFYDTDKSGDISKAEFLEGYNRGKTLPDLGFGPGMLNIAS